MSTLWLDPFACPLAYSAVVVLAVEMAQFAYSALSDFPSLPSASVFRSVRTVSNSMLRRWLPIRSVVDLLAASDPNSAYVGLLLATGHLDLERVMAVLYLAVVA